MSGIVCHLECEHEIIWGESPETPGASLPRMGLVVWCEKCEEDQEIVSCLRRYTCYKCGRLSSYAESIQDLLDFGWKGSLAEEGEFLCDECQEED